MGRVVDAPCILFYRTKRKKREDSKEFPEGDGVFIFIIEERSLSAQEATGAQAEAGGQGGGWGSGEGWGQGRG